MTVKPLPKNDLFEIWSKIFDLKEMFANSSLFLTGGSGFFGKWILETLIYAKNSEMLDVNVTVLSRAPENFLKSHPHIASQTWIRWIKGTLDSFEYPREKVNYIIHAAADTERTTNPLVSRIQLLNSINGAEHLIRFAKKNSCQNILFTSSGAVYSSKAIMRGMLNEDDNCEIDVKTLGNTYGLCKLVTEHQLRLYAEESGCNVTVARCFSFIGPGLPLNANYAIGNFLRDAIHKRNIELTGDGKVIRSYLYASDLTYWLLTMLLKSRGYQVFNVGSSFSISILELATLIAKKYKVNISTLSTSQAELASSAYYPDITKAHAVLGLKETVGINQAIEKTVEWLTT